MSEKNKRWTVVDTVIVIAAVAAIAGVFNMFGTRISRRDEAVIEAQILISNQDPELGEAIKAAEGEDVTLSLTEKDSGVIKAVDVKKAEVMVYDAINGVYNIITAENNVDIYATVELNVEETDYAFLAGSTQIKVGNAIPFRGKGYATSGNVIVINREGGINE